MEITGAHTWIISPHFDDGIFGCGELLAAMPGCGVLTVFGGMPAGAIGLTDWDRQCGFTSSLDAVPERRRENTAATAIVGAREHNLDVLDGQYGPSPSIETLGEALDEALRSLEARVVIMPLGLFHSDHVLVHQAALLVRMRHPEWRWLGYEDALYRRMPGMAQARLAALHAQGVVATPAFIAGDAAARLDHRARKRRAVQAYASQLKSFGPDGYHDTDELEHYWELQ